MKIISIILLVFLLVLVACENEMLIDSNTTINFTETENLTVSEFLKNNSEEINITNSKEINTTKPKELPFNISSCYKDIYFNQTINWDLDKQVNLWVQHQDVMYFRFLKGVFDFGFIPLYSDKIYPLTDDYSIQILDYDSFIQFNHKSSKGTLRLYNFTTNNCSNLRPNFDYDLSFSCEKYPSGTNTDGLCIMNYGHPMTISISAVFAKNAEGSSMEASIEGNTISSKNYKTNGRTLYYSTIIPSESLKLGDNIIDIKLTTPQGKIFNIEKNIEILDYDQLILGENQKTKFMADGINYIVTKDFEESLYFKINKKPHNISPGDCISVEKKEGQGDFQICFDEIVNSKTPYYIFSIKDVAKSDILFKGETCQIFEDIKIGDRVPVGASQGEWILTEIYDFPSMVILKNGFQMDSLSYGTGVMHYGGLSVKSIDKKSKTVTFDYYDPFCGR